MGGNGASRLPWQAKCKYWAPPLVDILIFSILQFVVCLRFSGCFLFLPSMNVHGIQKFISHFLTFS